MRIFSLMMAGVCLAGALMAQPVDKYSAARTANVTSAATSGVAMWIFSDKYTYQPGQALTLRWTVKTNNDLYPYTVFVYEQNNQTGVKRYYPGNTATPTDIAGKTAAQGFEPRKLSDVTKQVLLGSGGVAGAAWTAPTEYGMHTFIVELRDYNGGRVIKTAYMKIGVVKESKTISGAITTNTTLTNDTEWHISGIVFVKSGGVLNIEPGTFVIGNPGSQPPSALIVTTTGTIEARGTATRPIVMTSASPFGQRQRGDWGGLVLLGKASINVAGGTANNNPNGQFYIEGLQTTDDALYGGTDDTHYCGTLTYVRVEYAGSILSPNNELNSFTFGGCGTKTVAEHLQAIYGLDDSFEWFGGTMYAKYLVGGLGADDYLDFQLGWRGKVQYGIFYQSPDARGNRGVEGDNSEYNRLAEPFSNPTFSNLTFIGSGVAGYDEGTAPGLYLRRGARATINNTVVTRFRTGGVHLDDAETVTQANNGLIKMNGILVFANNTATAQVDTLAGNISNAAALAFLTGTPAGGAQNILATDPMLIRPFEYSDPSWGGRFGSPIFQAGWVQMPDDGFFDPTARFIGGMDGVDWTEGWTYYVLDGDMAP